MIPVSCFLVWPSLFWPVQIPCEACSSVLTFKGVCFILRFRKPRAFLLENVDSIDTTSQGEEILGFGVVGVSNMALVLRYLRQLGYTVFTERVRTDEYGLPQRRVRVYFFGVKQSPAAAAEINSMASLLNRLKRPLKTKPDAWFQESASEYTSRHIMTPQYQPLKAGSQTQCSTCLIQIQIGLNNTQANLDFNLTSMMTLIGTDERHQLNWMWLLFLFEICFDLM
eukprot:s728_g36.t1